MPTIKGIPGPYRFFCYSFDCNEPKYVHVQRENLVGKFWLDPLDLGKNYGFSPKELGEIRRFIQLHKATLRRHGMSIAVKAIEPKLLHVRVSEDEITAFLLDGRTISVPIAWSWRLSEATPE